MNNWVGSRTLNREPSALDPAKAKKEKHCKRCEIDQQRFQFELQIEKRELTKSHDGNLGLGIWKIGDIFSKGNIT